MTDSGDENDHAELRHLPRPRPGAALIHHILGDEVMVADVVSPSGYEQKEKTCKNCGSVRVTMIGSPSPRAWRRTADGPQITTTLAPPCDKDAGWPR